MTDSKAYVVAVTAMRMGVIVVHSYSDAPVGHARVWIRAGGVIDQRDDVPIGFVTRDEVGRLYRRF